MFTRLSSALAKAVATATLLAMAAAANAGVITATATLDSTQNVDPSNPNASSATGSATMTFDTDTGLLSLVANIDGISLADITFPDGALEFGAAGPFHVHNAPVGANGPVVVPFNMESFFADNGMGGLEVNATDIPFAIDLLDELTAGNLYLNLHTLDYGSGEIRGQLASVPEPASIALLGGMLGFIGMRRKRLALAA